MAVADLSIALLTGEEIKKMEAASRIVADVLNHMKGFVKPGVTTIELDAIVEDFIRTRGGEPAFKGYEVDGKLFPSSACISVDEEVVHGMPGQRMLKEGQIVTIDVGVQLDGFFGDSAYTYGVGEISTDKQRLLDATNSVSSRQLMVIGCMTSREPFKRTLKNRVFRWYGNLWDTASAVTSTRNRPSRTSFRACCIAAGFPTPNSKRVWHWRSSRW
jgi:hypothetical protein